MLKECPYTASSRDAFENTPPLGPQDFPRAGILHPSALGPQGAKSPPLGRGGCIFQYIPSLGSVRIHYTPSSPVLENTALGTVFLDTLLRANIRNTSLRRKH